MTTEPARNDPPRSWRVLRGPGTPGELHAVLTDIASAHGLHLRQCDPQTVGHDLAAMRDIARTGADAVIAAQLIDQDDIGSFGVVDTSPGDPARVADIRQRPGPDRHRAAGPGLLADIAADRHLE
ncbi:MAG: hypothetical protein M3Y33_21480 [Actinomycetota bacterium]|nr:hypothetical protein [Actinomycetota bacterium]